MKFNRIIAFLLIFSVLAVNSTIAFAEGAESYENTITNIDEAVSLEVDTTNIENLVADTSNFNGYTKPATNTYEHGFGTFQNEYFATHYFNNLYRNYGNNTHGSCGYIAVAMLLSYYDVYWDDSVIDEKYEKSEELVNFDLSKNSYSPGINKEDNSLCPSESGVTNLRDLNVEDYWEVIDNNWENYFHLYLIKLAEEEFNMYHNGLTTLEECGITVVSEAACASTMLQQKKRN